MEFKDRYHVRKIKTKLLNEAEVLLERKNIYGFTESEEIRFEEIRNELKEIEEYLDGENFL